MREIPLIIFTKNCRQIIVWISHFIAIFSIANLKNTWTNIRSVIVILLLLLFVTLTRTVIILCRGNDTGGLYRLFFCFLFASIPFYNYPNKGFILG